MCDHNTEIVHSVFMDIKHRKNARRRNIIHNDMYITVNVVGQVNNKIHTYTGTAFCTKRCTRDHSLLCTCTTVLCDNTFHIAINKHYSGAIHDIVHCTH